ncbi:hypothetical protein ACFW1A_31030 [Kitasatospora sp. NPDC058965]|uniref:hypothetical protein n=1 Tax=Kitasatospora sp. NPDC058965 TaxID=3346682 RepID=UPI00369395C6
MSDAVGGVTQEQVEEQALRMRERLGRWRGIDGFDPVAALDVVAAARRAVEVRARPRPSAREVLTAVRPRWAEEAAARGLTGEARSEFVRQILASDSPQVACESPTFWTYAIHLNRAAVLLLQESAEQFNQVLEAAAWAEELVEDIVGPLVAFIGVEAASIVAVSNSTSNGQVVLVGVYPVPVVVAQSDPDYDWDFADMVQHIVDGIGDVFGGLGG